MPAIDLPHSAYNQLVALSSIDSKDLSEIATEAIEREYQRRGQPPILRRAGKTIVQQGLAVRDRGQGWPDAHPILDEVLSYTKEPLPVAEGVIRRAGKGVVRHGLAVKRRAGGWTQEETAE